MKPLFISCFCFILFFSSCSTHYERRTFNWFASTPLTPVIIPTNGYYYHADSPRYERFGDSITGFTTIESVCHHFIILANNGKAQVNLTSCYDGLNHLMYSRRPIGKSTKASAHNQFLRNAREYNYFDLNLSSNGNFRMYNDTIVILYYQAVMGDYQVIQLNGKKMDSSSFRITRKKSHPFRGNDEYQIDSVDMVFRFEKYPIQ